MEDNLPDDKQFEDFTDVDNDTYDCTVRALFTATFIRPACLGRLPLGHSSAAPIISSVHCRIQSTNYHLHELFVQTCADKSEETHPPQRRVCAWSSAISVTHPTDLCAYLRDSASFCSLPLTGALTQRTKWETLSDQEFSPPTLRWR